ncbi:MAG: flagellar basal body M-ring protein FliF, partial [Betaproteobacteria bacterium]|nr:flagellar basal body M-ring protein FliF [Betaproteobacteria bacterium]
PHPMSAQQLAQVRQLVQDAIGYDPKRGDQVSVVSMPFGAAGQALPALPWWRSPLLWDGLRQALPYLLALVLGLLIYRAVRRLASAPGGAAQGREPAEGGGGEGGASGGGGGGGSGGGGGGGELAPDVVHLSNTFENDAAVSRELAKQDPRRAAQVVKEWLADGQ